MEDGCGKRGEMTQTLYAKTNKKTKRTEDGVTDTPEDTS
jgi:hypothetical protein